MKTSPFSKPGSDWKRELRRFLKQLRERQDWLELSLHEMAELQSDIRAEARMVELFLDLLDREIPPE